MKTDGGGKTRHGQLVKSFLAANGRFWRSLRIRSHVSGLRIEKSPAAAGATSGEFSRNTGSAVRRRRRVFPLRPIQAMLPE